MKLLHEDSKDIAAAPACPLPTYTHKTDNTQHQHTTQPRPYVKLLHEESKDIAGMLSQLPAEVSVEDTIKTQVRTLWLT